MKLLVNAKMFIYYMIVNIGISTTNYGVENAWRLEPKSNPSATECFGAHYPSHVNQTVPCKLEEGMYELICEDSWGDGWEGGFLEIVGIEFCKDFRHNFPNDCGESYVYGCNTERRIQYITITGMVLAKV